MLRACLLAATVSLAAAAVAFSAPKTTAPPESVHCATCTGSSSCRACKNCRYCKHCKKNGGTCGVCRPPRR